MLIYRPADAIAADRLRRAYWHGTRPGVPLSPREARRLVGAYVTHYNTVRLHGAIGYVTAKDKLEGGEADTFADPAWPRHPHGSPHGRASLGHGTRMAARMAALRLATAPGTRPEVQLANPASRAHQRATCGIAVPL